MYKFQKIRIQVLRRESLINIGRTGSGGHPRGQAVHVDRRGAREHPELQKRIQGRRSRVVDPGEEVPEEVLGFQYHNMDT